MFPRLTSLYGQKMRLPILFAITSLGLSVLAASTPAAADNAGHRAATAVVVGSTAGSLVACGDDALTMSSTAVGGPTYISPMDGVITSWTHGAGPDVGSLRLLVARPSTITPGAYTIVAKSALQPITASTFNTFPAQVPIAAGQQLALDVDPVGTVYCGTLGQPGDVAVYATGVDTARRPSSPPACPVPAPA